MIVTILGAHGQVARQLTPLLVERSHTVRGVVRKHAHFDDLEADGAEPVLCDLESAGPDDLDAALEGSDTVVFAAGAGPGSGPERKRSLDRDGAIAAVSAAQRVGVGHFVIVSSMGADDPPEDDDTFSVYLRAKAAADDAVRDADLAHCILRPGALTDDEPSGRVELGRSVGRGEISRGDVAAVLARLVDQPPSDSITVEVISGDHPIDAAVAALASG